MTKRIGTAGQVQDISQKAASLLERRYPVGLGIPSLSLELKKAVEQGSGLLVFEESV